MGASEDDDIHDPAVVAALYDACAPRYDRWTARASFGLVHGWRRAAVRRLVGLRHVGRVSGGRLTHAPGAAPRVLDLMAGTGALWPHLLSAFPRARITALDLSGGMRRVALERRPGGPDCPEAYLQGSALEVPLEAEGFDLVTCTFGVKTLSPAQQTRLARVIARSLRPGGAFVVLEASDPVGWWLRPLYRAWLDRIVPFTERLGGHGGREFAMLGVYTQVFGDCGRLATALRDAGLVASEARHAGGMATSVAGIKPIAPADAPA